MTPSANRPTAAEPLRCAVYIRVSTDQQAVDWLSGKQVHVAIIADECDRAGVRLAFVTYRPVDEQIALPTGTYSD